MSRRAKAKLSSSAVQAANQAVGNRKLHPTNAADAGDRKKWMDAYAAAGGEIQDETAANEEVGTPVQPCPRPCIDLEYLHSDGSGVAGAEYTVESVDLEGNPDGFYSTSGTLDGDGRAHIADVPEFEQFHFYFESDPQTFEIKTERQPHAQPDAPAAESFLDSVAEWIWGTVQGDFNKDQSFSQIAVNTVLGLIPIVDQVLDVRDIIAGLIDIIDYYSKSDEKQDKHEDVLGLDYEFWIWVNVFIIAIGSIPIVGSAVKGVLKSVIVFLKRYGKLATELSPAQLQRVWELIVSVLNGFGVGNAHRWLKEFPGKLDGWMDEAATKIKGAMDALSQMFDAMEGKAWLLGRERAKAVVAKLRLYKQAIAKAYTRLDAMKAKINAWFKKQIDAILQGAHRSETRGSTDEIGNRTQTTAEAPDVNIPAGRHLAESRILAKLEDAGIDPGDVTIHYGDPDNVIIIGRDMNKLVKPAAKALDLDIDKATFATTDEAWDALKVAGKDFDDGLVPYELVHQTEAFQENLEWIQHAKENGFTVIDVGRGSNSIPSAFYDMERAVMNGTYGSP